MKNKNKGFTLVELLIALAVFSMLVLTMTAVAFSVIQGQRKAFALQNAQEASRYILETMSKEIRMSTIDSAAGNGLSILNITNSKDESVIYQFSGAGITRNAQLISSDNLEISGGFYVRKGTFPERAVVTIVMEIKTIDSKIEQQAEMNLQSTVASR